jgi:hypothetical protein
MVHGRFTLVTGSERIAFFRKVRMNRWRPCRRSREVIRKNQRLLAMTPYLASCRGARREIPYLSRRGEACPDHGRPLCSRALGGGRSVVYYKKYFRLPACCGAEFLHLSFSVQHTYFRMYVSLWVTSW